MINLPMHLRFNLRTREVAFMHLELGFHVCTSLKFEPTLVVHLALAIVCDSTTIYKLILALRHKPT
jgi:hypothetical protein